MLSVSRTLSILPCDISPEYCTAHAIGRNKTPEWGWQWKTRLAALRRLLRASQAGRGQTDLETCHLLSLPVELLFDITTFLAAHERVALTLTCKALYSALGTTSFAISKSTEPSTSNFQNLLRLLHHDIQSYRLCAACNTLHRPQNSTVLLPRNKLRRTPWHPCVKLYLYVPSADRHPDPLYWLSKEHLQRVLSGQVCIDTLRCKGSVDIVKTLPPGTKLDEGHFKFDIKPVITRKAVIFHAEYGIQLFKKQDAEWIWDDAKAILDNFDFRCCLHCSADKFLDEVKCFLYHEAGGDEDCIREGDDSVDEGCGHHKHDCECLSEFLIESGPDEEGAAVMENDKFVSFKVRVWQWLGDGGRDDKVMRLKGMLRNLYEDAVLEEKSGGD